MLRSTCARALAFLMLSSAVHAQTQNLFFQPPTYPGLGQIVTADFNGDGKPDLVGVDGTVLLGNGDGTFKQGTSWSIAGLANGGGIIATGDFNGDGKPDLLLSSSTVLYVLLGNGDGTFQKAIATNIGATVNSLIAVDVNGDGRTDVLAMGAGELFVCLAKADGTFAPSIMYPAASVSGVTVGDFNGDGKLDLVLGVSTGGTSPSSVQVMLGNGDGTFQTGISSTSGPTIPFKMAVGDVNGDGKLDLVLTDGSTQTVTLLGNGDGTFQAPGTPLGASGGVLTLLDLNRDGKLDLIIEDISFVEIFLGKGDGTFALKHTYFAEQFSGGTWLATADFNGDGVPDIAVDNKVLIGNGDGSFQDNPASQVGPIGLALVADFNGDGVPDIAGVYTNVKILLNDGAGVFSLAHTYTLPEPASSLATGDLNGDGKPDLAFLIGNSCAQSVTVMLGNGDGSFGSPVTSPTGTGNQCLSGPIVIADFNGDHKLDAALLDPTSSNLLVLPGNGDGTFASAIATFAGQNPNSFVVGDFNNDGIIDMADTSAAGLGILLGIGDGTFRPANFPNSAITRIFAAGDLNGDGNLDLITGTNNGLQVLLGNGDGTFTALPLGTNPFGGPVAVADVNGDGKLDLVTGGGVNVALGNGDGTFGNVIPVFPGYSFNRFLPSVGGQFVLAADFNGDKRIDVVADISPGQAPPGTPTGGLITVLNVSQPPTPDFLIAAKPLSPPTVAPGNSGSSTVTLTPINGFSGAVTLSCTGLPSGASCSFSPSSLNGSGTSTLAISTASSMPVGSYPVVVTGSSASLTHSVAVTLTLAISSGATTITLAPRTVVFASQAMGVTSSAQVVELSNTGAAPLTISGISTIGANIGDFAQNNTCGSGIAAGASCQISVTFTPAGMGARTAAVSVTDNGTGSPHMVTLTGAGPDFALSLGSPLSATVSPGQTATYTISVAPSGSFNQSVMLTCGGNPTLTICTVSPNAISLNGTSATTATVTVTTTAPSHGSASPFGFGARVRTNYGPRSFLIVLLGTIMIAGLLVWHRSRRVRWAPLVTLSVLLWTGMMITSCGGGSSGSIGGPGTQAGTYTITVTGSSVSGSSTLTHTTTLTLVVQ